MKIIKYFEFVESDLEPIKSFHFQDELNPKVWSNFEIKEIIKNQLLKIADDFYKSTDLNANIQDIVLTGSLSNYNWSEKYSDYDLHILIDFTEINNDVALVKKYVDSAKNNWNKDHEIFIEGYEVEVYIQDINEPHKSSGVFSLLNNKWNVKPSKIEVEIDEIMIEEKAKTVMMKIDDLEDDVLNDDHSTFDSKLDKVWTKIKNFRKMGLEEKGGEFSTGNLIFKLLRRNGYIGKVVEMKRKSYDNQFK